jgi:hypothetical protein
MAWGTTDCKKPKRFPAPAQQIYCLVSGAPICFHQAVKGIPLMTLNEAVNQVKACAKQMDARYGQTVFDEWAVISLAENKARVLAYIGPRNDDFLKNFAKDLGALRAELLAESYGAGDFEFARHGVGTGFESFMVLGRALYLICNNTRESMDAIAKDPRWIAAQVPFAELSERIRANPLEVSGDNTKFLKKD